MQSHARERIMHPRYSSLPLKSISQLSQSISFSSLYLASSAAIKLSGPPLRRIQNFRPSRLGYFSQLPSGPCGSSGSSVRIQ